jgi:hypothetical protein
MKSQGKKQTAAPEIGGFSNLTLLETSELVKLLEKKLGVSATATPFKASEKMGLVVSKGTKKLAKFLKAKLENTPKAIETAATPKILEKGTPANTNKNIVATEVVGAVVETSEPPQILPQVKKPGSKTDFGSIDFSKELYQLGFQDYDASEMVSSAGVVNFAALYAEVIDTSAIEVAKKIRAGNYSRAKKISAVSQK